MASDAPPFIQGALGRAFLKMAQKRWKVEDGRLVRNPVALSPGEQDSKHIIGIDPGNGDSNAVVVCEVRDGRFHVLDIRRNVTEEDAMAMRRRHGLIL